MLTHDFGWFRLHGGYALQSHNNTALFGVDKTFKLLERNFTLRSDVRQIEDKSQWLASMGAMYEFCKFFALETWGSFPTESGGPSMTVKLDFAIRF